MNFSDRQQGSITSLLAQLREAQDGPPPAPANVPSTKPKSPGHTDSRIVQDHAGASSRQLNDLLSSLGKTQPIEPSTRRQLIEPFGPISSLPSTSNRHPVSTTVGETGRSELSLTKALPILSTLLEDEGFKMEVRRMKVDQDTLERRLWAKMEKVRGEHEKTTRTDREMVCAYKREWDRKLESTLQEFYRNTCLPSIDGLATRHREKLEGMGVPGLGGDMGDKTTRERVRRIMDVLEGGLEE